MEQIKNLLAALSQHFEELARANAVVAKPISMGERHVVPLCELGLAIGGAGGLGEGKASQGEPPPKGLGGGAGGGAKAAPIAVLVVDGDEVRLEKIGD